MNQLKPAFYLAIFFGLLGFIIVNHNLIKIYRHLTQDSSDEIKILLISKSPNRFETERKVFKYFKFQEVDNFEGPWNIFWSNEYPFYQHKKHLSDLQTYQRINHFPGLSQITIKKQLSTLFHHHDFIPKGFTFPKMKKEFLTFKEKNRDIKFVEKRWKNRGVKLISNINEKNFNDKEKFLQAFIHNPLLIDNRIFDVGIYVLISSFAPIFAYRFNKEILLRFCSKDYHPFNEGN